MKSNGLCGSGRVFALACFMSLTGAACAHVSALAQKAGNENGVRSGEMKEQRMNARQLTWKEAQLAGMAALDEAHALGWRVSVAVVDPAGYPLFVGRLDGAIMPSVAIATAKARASALYGLPTGVLEQMTAYKPAMADLPDFLALEGAVPIMVSGVILGAIGVSGMSADQDLRLAMTGRAALGLPEEEKK